MGEVKVPVYMTVILAGLRFRVRDAAFLRVSLTG